MISRGYWRAHLQSAVRLKRCVAKVDDDQEKGGHQLLRSMIGLLLISIVACVSATAYIMSMSDGEVDRRPINQAVASDPEALHEWLTYSPPNELSLPDAAIGTDAGFQFRVLNTAGEVIKFGRTSSGCSCTQVKTDSDVLAPGESAMFTGTIRGTLKGEGKIVVPIDVYSTGVSSGRLNVSHYRVRIGYVSSISISHNLVPGLPHAPTVRSRVGDIFVKNRSSKRITLGCEVVRGVGISVELGKNELASGATESIEVYAEGRTAEDACVQLMIDGRRELRTIAFMTQIVGGVSVTPRTLVLGEVTSNGNQVESRFPCRMKAVGELTNGRRLVIGSLPPIVKSAKSTVVSTSEIHVECELAVPSSGQSITGEIELRVETLEGEVLQTINVPIIGFVTRKSG